MLAQREIAVQQAEMRLWLARGEDQHGDVGIGQHDLFAGALAP